MGVFRDEWRSVEPRRKTSPSGEDDNWPFVGGKARQDEQSDEASAARQRMARRIERFCELRQAVFDGIIHDAPFNLLIDMYVNEHRRQRVTVGDACVASRVPQTTALRAIQTLIEAGDIERSGDASDSRRKLLTLTPKARDQITRFIDRFTAMGGF